MGVTQAVLQTFLETYFINTVGKPEGFYDDSNPSDIKSRIEFMNRKALGPDANIEWIRFTVIMQTEGTETLGGLTKGPASDKAWVSGFILIQLFQPVNTGSGRFNTLADLIRNNFQSFTTCENAVKFGRVDGPIDVGLDGNFYQQNVQVSFKFMRE